MDAATEHLGAYQRLAARFARIATLGEAEAVLAWDAAAVMPPGGAAARGDQLATLAGLAHTLLAAPETAADLAAAETHAAADAWDGANLALMRRDHARAAAVPTDLIEALARATTACEQVWRDARQHGDFPRVAPHLARVVALTRERAAALAPALALTPYDALLDDHQPGITTAAIEPIFARLAAFIATALPQVEARQAGAPAPLKLTGHFPADRQEAFCRDLIARAGLDFTHARLDRSAHPFCGGTPTDIRITMRYDEADPVQAMLAALHEAGHALYEANLPAARSRQPVGRAAGMAVHESQSLILEMQAARSDAYLGWLSTRLVTSFAATGPAPGPAPGAAWSPANLARLWRRVAPGCIRVDADELTYPAHIILRFDLERALIAGDLAIPDLPGAWNDGMRRLLGITPPTDRAGCLQDIHWYEGMFGYFPAYTLGAIAAAQLMQAARAALPELDRALARGDLAPLTTWLRTHIHQQGSRHDLNALLAAATGRPLDPAAFETHLAVRYLGVATLATGGS